MDAERSTSALVRAMRQLPKASMHLHLEGALRWSTVRSRHPEGEAFADHQPWLGAADPFPDFTDFLDVFQRFLRPSTGSCDAIELHTQHVLEDLAAQGVRYVDLIVSVPFHRERGLSQRQVLEAMSHGCARAAVTSGIDVQVVYGLNRHRPLAEVEAELDEALGLVGMAPAGLIAAIDLQGDERVGRAVDWKPLFRRAEASGLRLRAHAGELCGASSVREVLDQLGVRHISHGVRAIEDPALVRRLATEKIWLHVCPSSNTLLHVMPADQPHPLRALLDAGCQVTIDADDPVMFGVDISAEQARLVEEYGFEPAQVADLAIASIRACALEQTSRSRAIDDIERWKQKYAAEI
ncbi:MAG: adenosine deaminase family protein [Pseudomonadota bacterium]